MPTLEPSKVIITVELDSDDARRLLLLHEMLRPHGYYSYDDAVSVLYTLVDGEFDKMIIDNYTRKKDFTDFIDAFSSLIERYSMALKDERVKWGDDPA